jgi:hypothetical protein
MIALAPGPCTKNIAKIRKELRDQASRDESAVHDEGDAHALRAIKERYEAELEMQAKKIAERYDAELEMKERTIAELELQLSLSQENATSRTKRKKPSVDASPPGVELQPYLKRLRSNNNVAEKSSVPVVEVRTAADMRKLESASASSASLDNDPPAVGDEDIGDHIVELFGDDNSYPTVNKVSSGNDDVAPGGEKESRSLNSGNNANEDAQQHPSEKPCLEREQVMQKTSVVAARPAADRRKRKVEIMSAPSVSLDNDQPAPTEGGEDNFGLFYQYDAPPVHNDVSLDNDDVPPSGVNEDSNTKCNKPPSKPSSKKSKKRYALISGDPRRDDKEDALNSISSLPPAGEQQGNVLWILTQESDPLWLTEPQHVSIAKIHGADILFAAPHSKKKPSQKPLKATDSDFIMKLFVAIFEGRRNIQYMPYEVANVVFVRKQRGDADEEILRKYVLSSYNFDYVHNTLFFVAGFSITLSSRRSF